MGLVLKTWEDDNTNVYFEGVPKTIPKEDKFTQAVQLSKLIPYEVESVDPLPLSIPQKKSSAQLKPLQRSDSDLARELQKKLNAGLE
jgi:hypothetical protein